MKININLFDPKSIDNAIKEIERYRDNLHKACEEIARRLAEIGAEVVKQSYSITDELVNVEPVKTETGYAIIAKGENVVFLEFGTGIFTEDYEHPNATGLPNIAPGSWSQTEGKGHFIPGEHEYWYYNHKKYSGTVATQGFYFAKKKMVEQATQIIREELHKWLR